MKFLPFSLILCTFALTTLSEAGVLYDASSNVAPDASPWGWTYGAAGVLTHPVTAPSGNGYVTLSTGSINANSVGWAKSSPIILDPTKGFNTTWNVQLVSESHASDNLRAGLSFFALGSDKKGVEIGFWQDRIFAYNDNQAFSPGESYSMDTMAAMHTYSLNVTGTTYKLLIDGVNRLDGSTRNYAAVRAQYNVANALWFGDDTSRAQSVSRWGSMSASAVPEPGTYCVLGLGLAFLIKRKRN